MRTRTRHRSMKPRPKLSISIDPAIIQKIDDRGEERSTTISRDLHRYYGLLREARGLLRARLSSAELSAIVDILNGHRFSHDVLRGIEIWATVEDGCRVDGLDARWQIDGPALVATLQRLDRQQHLAIADAVEQFWLAVDRGDTREPARALD